MIRCSRGSRRRHAPEVGRFEAHEAAAQARRQSEKSGGGAVQIPRVAARFAAGADCRAQPIIIVPR